MASRMSQVTAVTLRIEDRVGALADMLDMLREAGMSLEALQQQAGHKNINTTRVYLHLSNQALRDEYFRVSDQLFTLPAEEVSNA